MSSAQRQLAARASEPQNFTARAVALGCIIGTVIVFSNMYFGLQTGWISGMNMPGALLGFAAFRGWEAAFPSDRNKLGRGTWSNIRYALRLRLPFSPVENVLIQSVSGSVGTMPLGCGFVGVVIALEKLLRKDVDGTGPIDISLSRLIVWAVGICLFGVVFGVPLRKQVIIKEKLKFPSGTATALMIGVLHGEKGEATIVSQNDRREATDADDDAHDEEPEGQESERLIGRHDREARAEDDTPAMSDMADWKTKIRNLGLAVLVSGTYTIFSYFVPQIHKIPILGAYLASKWEWTFNPSPAYVGQGIIMGPATTMHMLLGAIIGWGILSPIAKNNGWAPGDVDDWQDGSKGWIMWISLAIMLADSVTSLGWLVLQPSIYYLSNYGPIIVQRIKRGEWRQLMHDMNRPPRARTGDSNSLTRNSSNAPLLSRQQSGKSLYKSKSASDGPDFDAPPEHLIHSKELLGWLALSLVLYFASIHVAFPRILPFGLDILALLLATLLSIMGVRALGSTDLNPVSGISKLTQLLFAVAVPMTNPLAVPINMLAGAVSESGALQAGDLLQDLKAGHLLGAAPNAQFYGQLIGSVYGAVISAVVYRLYTTVYDIPGGEFQVPSGYMWLFTAELVTGKGLPPFAGQYALIAAAIFVVLTSIRIAGGKAKWVSFVPGGIAVAVGMYNTPSFTLARAVGGLGSWWWTSWRGEHESGVVVLASGLILGEGLTSIVNLGLQSWGVPHL